MQLSKNCFTVWHKFNSVCILNIYCCPKHLLKSGLLALSTGLVELNRSTKHKTRFVIGIKCHLIVSHFPHAFVKHSRADLNADLLQLLQGLL